jgi:hypothetical protein
MTKCFIIHGKIPDFNDVWAARNNDIIEIIENKLSQIDTTKTNSFSKELIKEFGSERLVSVLIESLSRKTDISEVSLTGEPPVVVRKQGSSNRNRNRNRSGDNRRRNFNSDKGDRQNRSERSDRSERPDRRDRSNRGERSNKNRSDRTPYNKKHFNKKQE